MKNIIIKNTITKALILFVALFTAPSLFAGKVECSGHKGIRNLDSGKTQTMHEFKFPFTRKFPKDKKVQVGKLGPRTVYLKMEDFTEVMTLTIEDEKGEISITGIYDVNYLYQHYLYQSNKEKVYIGIRCSSRW